VIGNPAAGGGRAARCAQELVRALEGRGHSVEWFATRAAGDACRCAGEREGAVDCIVVAGGDGTLNEVLNGLTDPGATPLLPMPLGTANMLSRALGIPRDAERLADAVEASRVRIVDVGLASLAGGLPSPQRFLSVAGVGFDAEVTQLLSRLRRGPLGYRGYVAPIARRFLAQRAPRLSVRLDGGPAIEGAFVIVVKLASYGGVLRIAPDARPDDGRLHACVFRRAGRLDLLRFVVPAFRGRLAGRPDVVLRTARSVEVDADGPVAVQLDGDYRGTTPLSLSLAPRGAAFRVPRVPDASG
jgi:YegS/Rv2252/BmrU family lipid kinase